MNTNELFERLQIHADLALMSGSAVPKTVWYASLLPEALTAMRVVYDFVAGLNSVGAILDYKDGQMLIGISAKPASEIEVFQMSLLLLQRQDCFDAVVYGLPGAQKDLIANLGSKGVSENFRHRLTHMLASLKVLESTWFRQPLMRRTAKHATFVIASKEASPLHYKGFERQFELAEAFFAY